ncbi:MAG: FKBP-type peptidyl-prolyl cis-trans isomerase [Pseudomonadota bacterium]
MKLKLPLIAAFVAITSLTACGGGETTPSVPVFSPATLVKTDISIGTGAEAIAPKTVTVHYTGWLYTTATADFKGTKFDSSAGGAPLTVKLGTNAVIPGFETGIIGMKVGGKRTVLIPAAQGYGSAGRNPIPPNSGLVFDIELVSAI